ncbi:hypothetical protein HRE53_21540 [Acaryochloris sp. 'Moss Beach']|uniref:hypothetical protein n=1 Tax=Acaryochloris sp. 'Moss Beach' TaxID=2740837 RepID=UPI001F426974|nr:hypothetical protein [Acaryochloris sp. 'Moss Beach']UJB68983.1 hypothetical protein HRE53_21540 [Acaryochloris sp. 'Moss Beach']
MGVVYIGDRAAGKTHLAMELTNPNYQFVNTTNLDYEVLKASLYNEDYGGTKPTDAAQPAYDYYLEINVKLPTGIKQIKVDWIDTPGEIWRKSWQTGNPNQWQSFLKKVQVSEGIVLVMSPYREIIKPDVGDIDDFITRHQWCTRFARWVKFFQQDCPRARHILLCLNKADLIKGTNLTEEAQKLCYYPDGSRMNWQSRHMHVLNRYFRLVEPQIKAINQSTSGLSVRCFITSVYNRQLLELPWIYLGSYI